MSSYAIYRLRHKDHCTFLMQTAGNPIVLNSLSDLNGQEGFVIAPFSISGDSPLLLLKPDVIETMKVKADRAYFANPDDDILSLCNDMSSDRASYHADFEKFHNQLRSGNFQKIVLSRCLHLSKKDNRQPEELFMRACNRYPRMFIALVSSELSGTWLFATPEILLDGDGARWKTMALAGTMRMDDKDLNTEGEDSMWSTKNIQEQRYVASYIMERLKDFTSNIEENGPYTTRAADLVHLRSDFSFTVNDTARLGDLLNTLHPTPAVCGLPKAETREFILSNEHSPRHYYSGFIGTIYPNNNTHLYVSLRCMQIQQNECLLYAGGGLLKESNEENEWMETENKLNTMRNVFK